MAVYQGRHGKVTAQTSASGANHTISELGEWSVGGMSRDYIEKTAFGDTWKSYEVGMAEPPEITFSGHLDMTDSSGQKVLSSMFNKGLVISKSSKAMTAGTFYNLKLWGSTKAAGVSGSDGIGYWALSTAGGVASSNIKAYVTAFESAHSKDGIATVSFTIKVTNGTLGWSTTT